MLKKRYILAAAICLAIAGCGKDKAPEEPVVAVVEMENTVEEPEVKEENEKTATAIHSLNHYYNSGIYIKDDITYRQFPDGLYERKSGSEEWKQLCPATITVGAGLACYGERLYFVGYQESEDTLEAGWNNTVFYYDIDSGDSGVLLTVECLVDDLVVYEDCLYMADYAEYGAYIQYKGYDLNADGTIKAELDEESDDFICKEQNVYEKRGYKVGKTSGLLMDSEMKSMKRECISIPFCASMLDGNVILEQYKDELEKHIYQRNLATGEDTFLFDAVSVFLITQKGIYYYANEGENLTFYDFSTAASTPCPTPENEILEIPYDKYLTYDAEAMYAYDIGSQTGNPRIVKISFSDGSIETITAGEELQNTENPRVNLVDSEYFYHGEQMYPLK